MELIISNKAIIKDATYEVFSWCRKNLEFANPEYAKKADMGLWLGNTEPLIILFEVRGSDIIIPYGAVAQFLRAFPKFQNISHYSFAKAQQAEYIHYKSHISLFSYQEKALECTIYRPNGVIVMPCGAGKTQTALELVARLGKRTLWLTHTYELLKQSLERAKSCFDMDNSNYGMITNGKIDVGKAITFATVQTMSNMDLEPYKDYWDCIIVDECHKAVGTPKKLMMFYKIVSSLNAYHKYGLTATPKRNDGLEKCMFALLGDKLCEISDTAVSQNTVPIRVWQVQSTIYQPNMDYIAPLDGTIDYARFMDDLCSNQERNKDIAQIVNQMNAMGKTCLVLSDRVAHLEILRKEVGEDYTMQIYATTGSKKGRAERKECIEGLKNKTVRCLFATYPLAKEGLDIPTLDCVVFATPKKDNISVIQSCGRVGRKTEGKTEGWVVDYVDESFSMLSKWGRIRKRFYKSKKYFCS